MAQQAVSQQRPSPKQPPRFAISSLEIAKRGFLLLLQITTDEAFLHIFVYSLHNAISAIADMALCIFQLYTSYFLFHRARSVWIRPSCTQRPSRGWIKE